MPTKDQGILLHIFAWLYLCTLFMLLQDKIQRIFLSYYQHNYLKDMFLGIILYYFMHMFLKCRNIHIFLYVYHHKNLE